LYLSWARPIQSTTLNPISKRSILMLYIHLRLMPEDMHENILPSHKGLVLEIGHELSSWSWDSQASARGGGRLRCCQKTAGTVALHWGSLDEACSSVKPDEARERVWLNPT
jgi:hypothetical protein